MELLSEEDVLMYTEGRFEAGNILKQIQSQTKSPLFMIQMNFLGNAVISEDMLTDNNLKKKVIKEDCVDPSQFILECVKKAQEEKEFYCVIRKFESCIQNFFEVQTKNLNQNLKEFIFRKICRKIIKAFLTKYIDLYPTVSSDFLSGIFNGFIYESLPMIQNVRNHILISTTKLIPNRLMEEMFNLLKIKFNEIDGVSDNNVIMSIFGPAVISITQKLVIRPEPVKKTIGKDKIDLHFFETLSFQQETTAITLDMNYLTKNFFTESYEQEILSSITLLTHENYQSFVDHLTIIGDLQCMNDFIKVEKQNKTIKKIPSERDCFLSLCFFRFQIACQKIICKKLKLEIDEIQLQVFKCMAFSAIQILNLGLKKYFHIQQFVIQCMNQML